MAPLLRSLRWLLSAALAAALVGLLAVVAVARDGGSFAVRGRSMEPAIPLGSLIRVSAIAPSQLEPGDIVTVRADNGVVLTHRLVRTVDTGAELYFELRGDANAAPDAALVPARALVGRVEHYLPFAGLAAGMLALPSGILSLLALIGATVLSIRLLAELEAAARSAPSFDAVAP